MSRDTLIRRVLKPLVFVASLGPLAWLAWLAFTGGLGANPIVAMIRFLGDWALRFLLIALAVTPLRELTGIGAIGRFRRMLGLFAFFYVILHFSTYIGLDQFFDWGAIWADIVKRTYITLGMAAVLILTALAVTSPKAMVKRLGGRNWQRLHRFVYAAGVLGVIHYYMMIKADVRLPIVHGAILAVLLGWRVVARLRKAAHRRAALAAKS